MQRAHRITSNATVEEAKGGLNEWSATLRVYLNHFQPVLCLEIKVMMEAFKNKKQNMQVKERERRLV